MKRAVLILLAAAVLAGAAACASRAAPAAAQPQVVEKFVEADRAAEESASAPAGSADQAQPNLTDRMIVRTAKLALVVTDTQSVLRTIADMTSKMGGYIAQSDSWRDGEQLRARITLRVPASRLDEALAEMKGLAVRVDSENIAGQDVTEEFSDLEAQLRNLEATEVELRGLLADVREKTGKAQDVLEVYRELTTIRGEIERVKGRMQYLENVTAMATINAELIPDVLVKPVVEPGWRPLETLRNASRALVRALKGLVDVVIWLVIYLLPILIIVVTPIVLLVLFIRWLRRRARGKKSSGGAKADSGSDENRTS